MESKKDLTEFLDIWKKLLEYASDNDIDIIPSLKGEYGKYYVANKLLVRGISDIKFEKKYKDIIFTHEGVEKSIEVKTFKNSWTPDFSKKQMEESDYFVILFVDDEKNTKFVHQFVFKKAEMKELLDKGYRRGIWKSKYLFYHYENIFDYESEMKNKNWEETDIERDVILNPQKYEQQWDKLLK